MLLRCGLSLRWEKPRGNGRESGMGSPYINSCACNACRLFSGRQSAEREKEMEGRVRKVCGPRTGTWVRELEVSAVLYSAKTSVAVAREKKISRGVRGHAYGRAVGSK